MSAKRVNVRRAPRAFLMVKSGLVVTPITRHEYDVERCGWVRPQDLEPVKEKQPEKSATQTVETAAPRINASSS